MDVLDRADLPFPHSLPSTSVRLVPKSSSRTTMRTTIAHGKSRYQQKDSTLWGLASTWEMRLTGPIPRPERTLTVGEPQTNGVAERFNRTLKEQIIHGRIYRNIAELRDAVRDFVELYNAQWIVEKNGYLSPAQARQAWHAAISIRPAA